MEVLTVKPELISSVLSFVFIITVKPKLNSVLSFVSYYHCFFFIVNVFQRMPKKTTRTYKLSPKEIHKQKP